MHKEFHKRAMCFYFYEISYLHYKKEISSNICTYIKESLDLGVLKMRFIHKTFRLSNQVSRYYF